MASLVISGIISSPNNNNSLLVDDAINSYREPP